MTRIFVEEYLFSAPTRVRIEEFLVFYPFEVKMLPIPTSTIVQSLSILLVNVTTYIIYINYTVNWKAKGKKMQTM